MRTNELLLEIFKHKDCTRTEFCKMLGYNRSQSNMSQWLNGKTELSLSQFLKFCDKLNVKVKIEIV